MDTHQMPKGARARLPDMPGIYLFYNKKGMLLYVGKATSLKKRVQSYWSGTRTSRPIEDMLHKVASVKWKKTDSVLEAIILEANYIKKYQPKYNVLGKDDKSWNYIVITKDVYPQVKTLRSHEYEQLQKGKKETGNMKLKNVAHVFGPYPGLNTKATLALLRKLFHFSTCTPGRKRPCLYYEMGQCLGVCIGEISPAEYTRQVIRPLTTFLRGRKKHVIKTLARRMKESAKEKRFEDAARLRNQIASLERIHDIALMNKSFFEQSDIRTANDANIRIKRIEGYDISNLGKSGKVGSMVVFDADGPVKSQYRKFKIKTVEGQSDVDCLAEVLERRLNHDEWPLPDILLVDGGKSQVNRAGRILKASGLSIPIVGIAKGPERKKNEFILGTKKKDIVHWIARNKVLLIRVRDEAHRFAIRYQRKVRSGRI